MVFNPSEKTRCYATQNRFSSQPTTQRFCSNFYLYSKHETKIYKASYPLWTRLTWNYWFNIHITYVRFNGDYFESWMGLCDSTQPKRRERRHAMPMPCCSRVCIECERMPLPLPRPITTSIGIGRVKEAIGGFPFRIHTQCTAHTRIEQSIIYRMVWNGWAIGKAYMFRATRDGSSSSCTNNNNNNHRPYRWPFPRIVFYTQHKSKSSHFATNLFNWAEDQRQINTNFFLLCVICIMNIICSSIWWGWIE